MKDFAPHTRWVKPGNLFKDEWMLVLKRKLREEIVIKTSDGDIVFKIDDFSGRIFKISFKAPKEIKILRGELDDRD
jgi:carbon storage regulator CsrA